MSPQRVLTVVLVSAALAVAGGCRRAAPESTVPLDAVLAGQPPVPASPAAWKDVHAFYLQRENRPAWISDSGASKEATDALDVLRSVRDHGLSPDDYGAADIARRLEALQGDASDKSDKGQADTTTARPRALAELDVSLTSALLAAGHDVAVGRGVPSDVDPQWKARRQAPDLPAALTRAVSGDLRGWFDSIAPVHPEYAALKKALAATYALQQAGGWTPVPAKSIRPGKPDRAVAPLRARLVASGDLTAGSGTTRSATYDTDLQDAVKHFQDRHGLKVTGIADEATIAAMNVPIDARIQQIAVNLERWRWLPDEFGPRHFLVNIPSYHVLAREDGKTVRDIRVVVGTPDHRTPVFSADMTTIVFSPYWNIPDTIVAGETAPAVAKDPKYLEKHHIEILRMAKSGAVVVNPSKVHWDDAEEVKSLAFRQKPGPDNALGHVKFLFPNEFDVYLHDTPADALFAHADRAFSHGCIRVEEPEELAKYVMRGDPDWDEAKILAAMNAGVEQQVKLKEKIPVHIVYLTAWVDEAGELRLLPDIYDYDLTQTTQISAGAAAVSSRKIR